MAAFDPETIGDVAVYAPTGEVDAAPRQLAPRLNTVRGARIAILDNCKEFADLVLKGVAEALQRDHAVAEVRFWRKDYLGAPSPFAPAIAAVCDAVVNGVGH